MALKRIPKKLKPYCNSDCIILVLRFATTQNNTIVVTNRLQLTPVFIESTLLHYCSVKRIYSTINCTTLCLDREIPRWDVDCAPIDAQ